MSSGDSIFSKIGYNLIHVNEIASTNTYLKTNYNNFNDKTILWADKQTNGRGRMERVWESSDDLTFSILLKDVHKYSIITPLAIVLALEEFNLETSIKWPNDIYYKGKKLSGILIESIYSDKFEAFIIGIGINYHDKESLNGIGISSEIKIDKNILIYCIINKIEQLKDAPLDYLIDKYKEKSLIINQNIMYHDEIYLACDITIEGSLVLTRENTYLTITSDEIDIKNALVSKK